MDNRPWIAFFSQTGSEIVELSKELGRWPDLIITNIRPSHLRTINPELPRDLIRYTQNKPEEHELVWLISAVGLNPIITLHGWLRVMPAQICDRYEIYNGHPGLITKYPELKGKDPQVRAFEGNYKTIGCVLHKVTPGVDEGEIIDSAEITDFKLELNEIFLILKDKSLRLWCDFLKTKL